MAAYDIKLTDSSTTTQNPYSGGDVLFGDIGGARFNFGGIAPASAWPWIIGIAAGALAFYWLFLREKK